VTRRKRQQEEHEDLERWLVSYADFVTLLFAFFVVMYAISSVNEASTACSRTPSPRPSATR
jgi:chemotaxis protein MotB